MDKLATLTVRAQTLAARVGLVIVLLLAAELFADSYSYICGRSSEDQQMGAECFQDAPWKRAYFLELRQSLGRWRWHPYTYWTLGEFHGHYINVDRTGIRQSWNRRPAQATSGGKPLEIFMFGGSTIWGNGARDDYTIPSLVAKHLNNETPYNVEVINFGLPAFVSMQEVLLLLEQLRLSHFPDLVVFYDGINDVFSAYQNRAAGLTMDEQSRAREFNIFNDTRAWRLYQESFSKTIRDSSLGKLAVKIAGRLAPRSFRVVDGKLVHIRSEGDASDAVNRNLAKSTADFYIGNVHIVQYAAKDLSFHSLFYLQPVLCFKKRLTPFERTIRMPYPDLARFYATTYHDITDQGEVHDLSRIFENTTSPYFLDYFHLSEAGNDVIAKAMVPDIIAALAAARNLPAGHGRSPMMTRLKN